MKYFLTVLGTLVVASAIILGAAFCLEFQNKGKSDFTDEYIQSKILHENRVINIRLPWDYENNPNETYPLVIKFDGDSRLHRHDQVLDVLHRTRGSSEAIIVAIPNGVGKRNRDLTPTGWLMDSDGDDARGQGDRFLEFIETELIPSIERRYRTNGRRIIAGYSRGGLMAVYSLLQKPELFDGAIALSPAFWRDNNRILDDMKMYLSEEQSDQHFLFISIGSEENEKMRSSFSRMESLLDIGAPKSLIWNSIEVANGNHSTAPVIAIPQAYASLGDFLEPNASENK